MKFYKNDIVFYANKKCIILATREQPYEPTFDVYNRRKIYPTKDYLISYVNTEGHRGIVDVLESEISKKPL